MVENIAQELDLKAIQIDWHTEMAEAEGPVILTFLDKGDCR